MTIQPGTREVTVEEFAAHPLEYLEQVERTGEELRIVREGTTWEVRPAPVRVLNRPSLRGMVTFIGDIETPIDDEWDAEKGEWEPE